MKFILVVVALALVGGIGWIFLINPLKTEGYNNTGHIHQEGEPEHTHSHPHPAPSQRPYPPTGSQQPPPESASIKGRIRMHLSFPKDVALPPLVRLGLASTNPLQDKVHREKEVSTEELDHFFNDLPIGDYWVEGEGFGWSCPGVLVHIQDNAKQSLVSMGFQLGGPIQGRIQDEKEQPQTDVPVYLYRDPPRKALATKIHSTSTNSNGDFFFQDVPPGPYLLAVGKKPYSMITPKRISVMSNPTKETIMIKALGSLAIQIKNTHGGNVSQAQVTANGPEKAGFSGITDSYGTLAAGSLYPGKYEILVKKEGFRTLQTVAWVESHQTKQIQIELER